jgi:hypothetical protein
MSPIEGVMAMAAVVEPIRSSEGIRTDSLCGSSAVVVGVYYNEDELKDASQPSVRLEGIQKTIVTHV